MAFTFNNDYSPQPPDEISLFLRQLLSRSSSSSLPDSDQINVGLSSSFEAGPNNVAHIPGRSDSDKPVLDRVPATCSYPNAGWSEIPASVCSNLTSPSIAPVDSDSHLRATENDADDYECDSEEGAEANKQNQVRNSCKRSRAAEVHNMSEKRRRSRINEKMKALQNLIPNSNKTDKASMLDDAIEYLKQLQLQVQMLTMRNGLIMHPMSLPGFPGVFDPVQIPEPGFNFSNVDGSSHPTVLPSGRPKHREPLANQQLDSLAGGVTEEGPFPLDNQIGSFRLPASSQSFCRDDTTTQHQLSEWASQTNALESMDPMPSSASKYSSLSSYLKDDAQQVLLTNRTSNIQLISSNLDGLYPGATTLDEI